MIIGSNTSETHPVISMEIIKPVNSGAMKLILADQKNIMIARFDDVSMHHEPGTDELSSTV